MKVIVNASELLAASSIAANKDARKVLCGVQVVCDGIYYKIKATDSFSLIEFSGDTCDDHCDGEVVIEADVIKKNVKASDKYVMIERGFDGAITLTILKPDKKVPLSKYHYNDNDVRIVVETENVNGAYPNFDGMFVVSDKQTADIKRLNATFINDLCSAISRAYGKNTPMDITFNSAYEPVTIKVPASPLRDSVCRCVVMPIRF